MSTSVTAARPMVSRRILSPRKCVDDDVAAVVDAVEAGHRVELGEIRPGYGRRADRGRVGEVSPGDRRLLAHPQVHQQVADGLLVRQGRVGGGPARTAVERVEVAD